MNIIYSVGDLKKALSAYPDDLKLVVRVGGKVATLNNDTQIRKVIVGQTQEHFEIDLGELKC